MSEITTDEPRVIALADATASQDHPDKLDAFRRERNMGLPPEERWAELGWKGHFLGYCEDAASLLERLEKRGFTIVQKPTTDRDAHNDMLIARIKGVPAQEGNAETDADPRNPHFIPRA